MTKPTPMTLDARLPRAWRLVRNADFQRVYRRRQAVSDHRIVVYGCENELPHPRLGLSVSRKVGGAVQRNRWKRLLREAFRLSKSDLPAGIDLVLIPRQSAEPDLAALKRSVVGLARRVAAKLARNAP